MNASRSRTPRTATGRLPGKPVCSDIGSLVVSRCCRAANGSVSRKLALDCAPRSGRPPWSGERRAPSGVTGTRGRGLLGGLNGGGEKLAAGRSEKCFLPGDALLAGDAAWKRGVVGVPTGVESRELGDDDSECIGRSTSGAGTFLRTISGGGAGKSDSGKRSVSLSSEKPECSDGVGREPLRVL